MRIMPPYLPYHRALVLVSGVFEVALGILLLVPRTSRLAAWGLIALLIAVFPANLYMFQQSERFYMLADPALAAIAAPGSADPLGLCLHREARRGGMSDYWLHADARHEIRVIGRATRRYIVDERTGNGTGTSTRGGEAACDPGMSLRMDRSPAGGDREEFRRMSPDTQTHTLPMVLMVVLVLVGVAALGLLYYRKRRLQGAVEKEFQGFREKAVALMDQLDALRQRHKTLPSTDPDFTAPMSGATLALYNAVEADLNGLWDRWLKVMELWDRAQKLVRSGSGLAVRQAEEARKLLDQGDIDDLLRQSASCKERLDRLNRGHEQAHDALEAGRRGAGRAARVRQPGHRGPASLRPSP